MEQVLVVKTAFLSPYIKGRKGLITGCETEVEAIVAERGEFLPRPFAEENPEYKQIIPYVTICRGTQVFSTTRLSGGGEKRLHGLISLGVGGHINPDTDGDKNALMHALRREIYEEVELHDFGALTLRGLINDDSNEVGKVHLGFFYTLTTTGEVHVKETEKLSGSWLRREELWDLSERMETWSQLVIPSLV